MQDAVAGTAMLTDGFEDEIDSVTPRSPALGMGVGATPGAGLGGLGGKKVRLFGEAGGPTTDRLDFKLTAAAVLSSGPGSGSDEDEVSEVRASQPAGKWRECVCVLAHMLTSASLNRLHSQPTKTLELITSSKEADLSRPTFDYIYTTTLSRGAPLAIISAAFHATHVASCVSK